MREQLERLFQKYGTELPGQRVMTCQQEEMQGMDLGLELQVYIVVVILLLTQMQLKSFQLI